MNNLVPVVAHTCRIDDKKQLVFLKKRIKQCYSRFISFLFLVRGEKTGWFVIARCTTTTTTTMTDVFKTTAKPILVLCQFFGLIDMCYAFESTGPLLVRYTNSVCLKSLELTRTIALLACTYAAYKSEFYYSQKLDLLKFWVPVIVARASEVWMIKYGTQ